MEADRPRANRPPMGRGGAVHRLPAVVRVHQHVIAHQGATEPIGGPFGILPAGRHHQQIGIGKPIPVALGQGAKQPDAAVRWPRGVPQALAPRRDPSLLPPDKSS
jgi:hypothetical protein